MLSEKSVYTPLDREEFTIEKVLAKDDAEVGIDVFLGRMNRWL